MPDSENASARRPAAVQLLAPLVSAAHQQLESGVESRQLLALRALAALGDPASVRALAGALRERKLRETARDALAVFPASGAIQVLKKVGEAAADPEFRASTVAALGDNPLPEADETLLGFAGSNASMIRRAAAEALGRRPPGPRVEETLLKLLNDPEEKVAVAAMVALREVGTDRCARAVLAILESSRNVFLRSTALLTLGRLSPVETHAAILRHAHDPNERIRASAIEALGASLNDHLHDAPVLLGALKDPDARTRGNAIVGLFPVDPDACRKPFSDLAKSTKPVHRATAAWVIGQLETPDLLQAFLPVINTELDKDVLAMTLRSIAGLRSPRLAPTLGRLLAHPHPQIRGAAVEAFGETAGPRERPRLSEAIASETYPDLRAAMVAALGKLSDTSTLGEYLPYLEDPAPEVVAAAVAGAAAIGDASVTPLLEQRAASGPMPVRARALVGLVRLGRSETVHEIAAVVREVTEGDYPAIAAAARETGELFQGAIEGNGHAPRLEALLEVRSLEAPAGPSALEPEVDHSAAWEIPLAKALAAGDHGASLAALAAREDAPYLAHYAARKAAGDSPTELEERRFKANHYLPGLFLTLERERARGRGAAASQRRYLELADAQLALYQEFLQQAHARNREGATEEVLRMLEFYFRQVKLAPDLHRTLGVQYLGLKHYELAFDHLLKAAAAAPQDTELLLQVAGAAIRIQKRSAAVEILRGVIGRLPVGAPHRERAEVLLRLAVPEPGPTRI